VSGTGRHPFQGIGASLGIAIGPAVVLETRTEKIFRVPLAASEVDRELERFDRAVARARRELQDMKHRVSAEIGKSYAGIFDAQGLILEDAAFSGESRRRIQTDRVNAEWALQRTARRFLQAFSSIDDPHIRDRGHDIEDVHNRLQQQLAGTDHRDLADLSEDSIVVAPAISPSDTILLKHPHVIGFCTDAGGRTSHTAIIANALEIPAVVGLHDFSHRVQNDQLLVLDGEMGVVFVDPPPEVLEEYERRRDAKAKQRARYLERPDRPALTADGVQIAVRANIELPEDIDTALRMRSEGVGLYRSEFLFLECSPELPSEDRHYEVYRMLAERCQPHGAVIRTLDLGGEKYFHDVLDRGETNPVMGIRAVRFCLKRPDIFKTQLRGLLRASAHGPIRVMFPLISGVAELRQVRAVLDECREELRAEGAAMAEKLDVGIMIEVPSAAAIADHLAREVDFFSIGTNDLIQYCLALDRGNDELAYLYEPFHPAVLRTLDFVIRSGAAAGIPVSLCGEMAAEPAYLPVLLGLGLVELSMNPASIPLVKEALERVDVGQAREVVRQALSLPTAAEITALVRRELLPDSAAAGREE
jgi:phosphotransferase system enzyme I (PtsI)